MSSSQDDDLEKILDDLNDSETEEEIQDQIEEIVRDEVDVDEDLNATEGCQANEESEGISYDDTIITDNLNDNENKEENDMNNDEEEKERSLNLKERYGEDATSQNENRIGVEEDILANETSHRCNLQPNRTLNYMHKFAFLSVHAGVNKWGDKEREVTRDELKMLTKEEVLKEMKKPAVEKRKNALMIHCFVKEKCDGRIKERAAADGRSQQRYTEEETYSPTVKLESIMLNEFVDAFEERHIVTVGIKGAFLKATVPENMEIMVKMTGKVARIMCEINQGMECDEQGIIYLRCVKALYRHIEAARLFYDDLNHSIQHKTGFKQKQYDPCIYNKGSKKEESVTLRVDLDDLQISSMSKQCLENIVQQLRDIYGEKKFGQDNDDEVIKIMKTPTNDHLFQVRKKTEAITLTKHQTNQFYSTVAKLLFLAKRGRPDILLAISFLTTRVKLPDVDEWKKLMRILGYFKRTVEFDLTISCDKLEKLTWYIDGSYATHEDMKGHTGAVLTTCDSVVLSRLNKQKVNTRSSMESELIPTDDTLPTVQWARLFMRD